MKLSPVALDKKARDELARVLAAQLKDQLDVEIGLFESLDLLEALAEHLGPYFYNQGLYDAQAVIKDRMDGIIEALEAIEKPLRR